MGVTTDDKASHEAEDWVKLILESSVMILQPWQSFQWARRPLKIKLRQMSLTDLAVAEMYWTTISRLVLRSFSRSGALRSSFRFMSSYTHTHTQTGQRRFSRREWEKGTALLYRLGTHLPREM